MSQVSDVKVIVFDTFGTVVDWRGSIVRDLSTWGNEQGISADWEKLADLWRGEYEPEKDRVRDGKIPWTNLDDLHLHALRRILPQVGIERLSECQLEHANRAWHRLSAWPEAVQALHRMKKRFVIGPLSNGNVSLLVNMAKFADLPWDNVFSCELFKLYKPHPDTYLGVARLMDVKPSEVMMCAAHNEDLIAAKHQGLMTAFVPRPTEFGPHRLSETEPLAEFDLVCSDLSDLADRLRV